MTLYELCMNSNINQFLDTIQHLTLSYADCKEVCYDTDEELRLIATKHTYRLFDPTKHNDCLTACKS